MHESLSYIHAKPRGLEAELPRAAVPAKAPEIGSATTSFVLLHFPVSQKTIKLVNGLPKLDIATA